MRALTPLLAALLLTPLALALPEPITHRYVGLAAERDEGPHGVTCATDHGAITILRNAETGLSGGGPAFIGLRGGWSVDAETPCGGYSQFFFDHTCIQSDALRCAIGTWDGGIDRFTLHPNGAYTLTHAGPVERYHVHGVAHRV